MNGGHAGVLVYFMKTGNARFNNRYSCPRFCAIFAQSLVLASAPGLLASSSVWTVSGVRDTGFSRDNQLLGAISPSGEVYSVSNEFYAPASPCTSPTLTLGDPSTSSSCVAKLDASGHQVFTVRIGGGGVEALRLDPAGNMYVWGLAGPAGAGFATTPGAYESNPPGGPDPFVCKLSGSDGHALFCTFIDVAPPSAFTIDSSGNTYVTGTCGGDYDHICVEKLNSTGTALGYHASISINSNPPSKACVAVDAQGHLFIAQSSAGVAELDPSGTVTTTSTDLGNNLPLALALDPAGNPEVILEDTINTWNMRLRRYSADLKTILFETPFVLFLRFDDALLMGVDSAGGTSIVGATYGVNLSPVHPTQTCSQPSASSDSAFLARFDVNGNLLQFTFLGIPANFLPDSQILFQSAKASLLYFATPTQWFIGNWEILTLGPASSEVTLSCIGDGATFANGPLSPNEIVSLFGAGVGPAQPVVAQPDARGIYPFQLGGTQVTFDGVAAPLLYVSANQINLVTPRALQGKTVTHVCAGVNNAPTNCLDVPVQPVTPAIFVSSISSGQYAAALNQDGTINSAANPAPVGSIVSVFATGLGAITTLPDGAITPWPPSQYPGVQIQATAYLSVSTQVTLPANVLYAGPAPLEIEGLAQINFVVLALDFKGFPGRVVTYAIQIPSSAGGAPAFKYSNGVQIWTK
jgi:uncharacterized protein (TIGR03437 family)